MDDSTINHPLTTAIGDTLTYTLGAMKPETVNADVITADAAAKQLALNKVSGSYDAKSSNADLLRAARSPLRKHISSCCLLSCNIAIAFI